MQPQSQAVGGAAVSLAPERFELRYAAGTHVGYKREHNEDTLFADLERRLFVVSDGMGGRPAGEVASALTVATLDLRLTEDLLSAGPVCQSLLAGIHAANDAVVADASEDSERHGMGATVVVGHVTAEGWTVVAHSGDSRAYLWRQGTLDRLTRDHVVVRESRRLLRRCVGRAKGAVPDVTEFRAEAEDRLLFCSDGLTDMVGDTEIAAVLAAAADCQGAVDALIETALSAGGKDNITVIVVEVTNQPD